jgi:quercetin dioxygenase-like cupin family protein
MKPVLRNTKGISGRMHRLAVVVILLTGTVLAQGATSTALLSKSLANIPGKEATMSTVEYAPGSEGTVHRHNAHIFVYVLEGSIVMQVRGGKPVTLGPGETFYEGPDDVHTVGRNASKTLPAKFLVFAIKDKGAPLVIPTK